MGLAATQTGKRAAAMKADSGNRRTDWRGADLRGSNLQGMDLEGADFRGADMRQANLGGAYVQGATLPARSGETKEEAFENALAATAERGQRPAQEQNLSRSR
jgi:uncharacterized protein YjbI with pentapeptide repeats